MHYDVWKHLICSFTSLNRTNSAFSFGWFFLCYLVRSACKAYLTYSWHINCCNNYSYHMATFFILLFGADPHWFLHNCCHCSANCIPREIINVSYHYFYSVNIVITVVNFYCTSVTIWNNWPPPHYEGIFIETNRMLTINKSQTCIHNSCLCGFTILCLP